MGRRPKTEAQRWLGGVNARKTVDPGQNFAAGTPPAPPHLSKLARKQYNRLVAEMELRQTGTSGDFATYAIFATLYSRWIEAKGTLDAEGLMVESIVLDSNGAAHSVRRLNPLLKVCQDSERQCLMLAAKLGLTPTDRSKAVPATGSHANEPQPGTAEYDHPELFNLPARAEVAQHVVIPPPLDIFDDEKDATDE